MTTEKWPTKIEVAETLQTTIRTIERHIAAGRIEARKRKRPGKPPETICNPDDVLQLMPAAHVMPTAAAPPQKPVKSTQIFPAETALQSGVGLLDLATLATIATGRPRPEPLKRWLTLEEAAKHSGLSEAFLKREAKAGRILAVRDERTWKLERRSLDQYEPAAQISEQQSED